MKKNCGGSGAKRRSQQGDELGAKWTDFEQKRLEQLVDEGVFSLSDSGAVLREIDDAFDKFSNNVIGYYVGQLKKKKFASSQDSAGGPVNQVLSQFGVIPIRTDIVPFSKDVVEGCSPPYELFCENMPFLRFYYMDYDSKQEKIVVLVDLPGGTAAYDWKFNDLGDKIIVIAEWNKGLYDVANLFRAELKAKEVTLNTPKLHAMQNEIVTKGFSENNIPMCRIHIPLGKRVQKDDGTWEVKTVQHDGAKIIIFEFSGFQQETLKQLKRGFFK